MDFPQLAMFVAVAREGSINAAARRLHRVPSNLTTRIRQLEDELGAELFIRERQRLRLSASGRNFLDYANRLLSLADEARSSVSGIMPKGVLSLGALVSTVAVRISPVLAEYHRRFPNVLLDLSTGPSGDLIDGVLDGRLAAAFVDGPVTHPLLDAVALYEEELVVISALGLRPIARARDVNGFNIYAFRPNCAYRRRFEDWFRQDDATWGKLIELESYNGMVACVAAGAGLALLPRSMLECLPHRHDVMSHEVEDRYRQVTIHLVWRKGLRLPSLDSLLEVLGRPRDGEGGPGAGREAPSPALAAATRAQPVRGPV